MAGSGDDRPEADRVGRDSTVAQRAGGGRTKGDDAAIGDHDRGLHTAAQVTTGAGEYAGAHLRRGGCPGDLIDRGIRRIATGCGARAVPDPQEQELRNGDLEVHVGGRRERARARLIVRFGTAKQGHGNGRGCENALDSK